MKKVIDIRLHHLLCMNGFVGKGYSEEFVQNFSEILTNLKNKTVYLKVVESADEICSRCPRLINGVCDREEVTHTFDQRIQKLLEVQTGAVFDWDQLIQRIQSRVSLQSFHATCQGCEWKDLGYCEKALSDLLK